MADEPNLDTPDAGDLNTAARRVAAKRGWAMPDGSFPIRPADQHGASDLQKAIRAVGRSGSSHNAVRRHIIKRARALGLSDQIPDNWSSEGASERSDPVTTFQRSRDLAPSLVPRDVPVEYREAAALPVVDFTERTIEVVAVPYDEETRRPVLGPDGKYRHELVERGAFNGIELSESFVPANREHDTKRTFGKIIDYRIDDPRGLVSLVRASHTALGDETLQLSDDGVLKASVGMLVRRSDQYLKNGVRRIRKAYLDHLAFLPNAAYTGAQVLAVREDGRSDMTVEINEVDPGDETAWEAAARIEAMASKIRRQ